MKKAKSILGIFVILITTTFQGYCQGIHIPDWTVISEDNKMVELTDTVFLDRPCVKLGRTEKSAIWNKNINLKNFRMELDIAGAVMSGIGFHIGDIQNYQFIYFRPGYGGTEEAVQYIPIYNGALSWVMYGKYQAAADFKKLEWFHAAIEVRGNNLKVFTNGNKKPDMDITMLTTTATGGSILLRTMFGVSYFANVSIRELPETITDWEISEQMANNVALEYNLVKKVKNWRKINERGDEYVNLCRYFEFPHGTLVAKHVLYSDSGEAKILNFDFAGKLHILLNGTEIFNYDKFKLDRMEDGTNRLRLNLKKGSNELVFLTEGDLYLFENGKGFNSLGRSQHQNWGFIASISKAPY